MRPKPAGGAADVGLLRVEELSTHFKTRDGVIRAVDGVSFSLDEGEVLGVVGESGCGKSVMAQSVLRILPEPLGRITGGAIHYRRAAGDTVDLARYRADDEELRALRGSEISMVFQEPMNSLHPSRPSARRSSKPSCCTRTRTREPPASGPSSSSIGSASPRPPGGSTTIPVR